MTNLIEANEPERKPTNQTNFEQRPRRQQKTKQQKKPDEKANQGEGLKQPTAQDATNALLILECRRRIMNFVESMLEPDITSEQLRAGEEFLCRSDYDSIAQERYILKLCGYPLCSNELIKEWKQRYHLSLRDKRIYDVEIRKLYCSVRCMDASIKYRDENLPEQPIWLRLDEVKIGPNLNFNIRESTKHNSGASMQ